MFTHSHAKGFTLIEIMIVVAIIGILASIAYPSYQESVRKSGRTDGKITLAQYAALQERYYTNNDTYASSLGATQLDVSTDSLEGYYTISVANASCGTTKFTCFTLTATAKSTGPQSKDKPGGTDCTKLTLNQLGQKTPAACW